MIKPNQTEPNLTESPESPATTADSVPIAWYGARRDRFRAEATELAARAARLANQRLLLFLGAFASAVWAYWSRPPLTMVLWVVAAILAVGFVVLVRRYRRVERRRRHLGGLADLADEALLRIGRNWKTLPLRVDRPAEPSHPYANDLDILGRGSLFHLLDSTGTRFGADTLRRWLLAPADSATIHERRAAVSELAPLAEWREELTWRGRTTGPASPDPEPFLSWAEGAPFLAHERALVWAARISVPLFWICLLVWSADLVPWQIWWIPLVANLLIGWRLNRPSVHYLELVSYLSGAFGAYADALDHLVEPTFTTPALSRLQAVVRADGQAAPDAIRRLHRLVRLAQPASSMVYPLIELTTLWNVHVLSLLEGWQARHGARARAWLVALGEVEALAALARLLHDNPAWILPELDPTADAIHAQELGHPLLPADARVTNDLTLGPPGAFLLVTGSNMSGKSTLLRTVGVNAVLAQAGGPVCAASLRLPPLDVWTAMRVADSLERGVSFFMAELERLKQVVDAARAATSSKESGETGPLPPAPSPLRGRGGERGVLYLLDEILQGTNTAERQIAARRVIRLLLRCQAIGAVSTHDLTLADAPDLATSAQAIHLTEMVTDGSEGARMTFDYRVRPGIARSTNALRLLDLVGLTEETGDRRQETGVSE